MKPEAWNRERAESFKDANTVAAYRYRAPYPVETFQILIDLITDEPRVVLDVGCGTGSIARNLVESVDRVDAIDFSLPMIEEAKRLPNGDNPRIHWIHDKIENATLDPPYSLIIAGMSLHWLDWKVVFPRFATSLSRNGRLAVVSNVFEDSPWLDELRKLRVKYRGYETARPHSVVEELKKLGLFKILGEEKTPEVVHSQTIEAYVEQYHSRSDMARVQIGRDAADRFDSELRKVLSKYVRGDVIEIRLHARVTWGLPRC